MFKVTSIPSKLVDNCEQKFDNINSEKNVIKLENIDLKISCQAEMTHSETELQLLSQSMSS